MRRAMTATAKFVPSRIQLMANEISILMMMNFHLILFLLSWKLKPGLLDNSYLYKYRSLKSSHYRVGIQLKLQVQIVQLLKPLLKVLLKARQGKVTFR